MAEKSRYLPAQWAHGPRWIEHAVAGDQWRGFDAVTVLDDDVLLALLLAVVGIGAGALLLGWLSFGGSATAYPPCDELPTVTQASDALASHGGLADEIAALGDGIHLEVATPCTDDATAALIEIGYATDAERDAIDALLGQRNGFGVPLDLVKR